MENRANYVLVGAFTLGVIASIFTFVWWFRAANQSADRIPYRIVFTGSVSGLSRGALVRFNGLSVGEVKTIELVPDDPSRVQAIIEVNPRTPVKSDTRARLEFQGLTGVASVQLTGGSNKAALLAPPDGKGTATLFAERSDFQDILETAQRLSAKLDGILTRVDKIIGDNEAQIGNVIKNVESFSKALSDNSAGVSAFLSAIGDTSQRISSLSLKLEKLSTDADELIRAIDPQSLNRTVGNIENFTQTLAENKANINSILGDAATLTRRLNDSTLKLDIALASITELAAAFDAKRLNNSIEGIAKFSDTLSNRSLDVDATIRDAASITSKLNLSVDKIDGVLTAAQSFLGVEGGANGLTKNMFAEITETAKAFRILAQNIDKRAVEITASINKLSGPGLRDLEALTSDTRKAVNDVGRAVRNLDRNPSQLLFGGKSPVPEYSGSR